MVASLSKSPVNYSNLSRPPAARVSGIVRESPGNLEYEVALFRESPPGKNDLGAVGANEIPVEQAVPIGTKLQLRASINTNSCKWNSSFFQISHLGG